MDTVFYVAGGVLVVIALLISFVGMRSEKFPSDGLLRIGVVLVALVVGFTSYAAVEASKEEALHREEEEDQEAAEETAEVVEENVEEAGGGSASGTKEEEAFGEGGPGEDNEVVTEESDAQLVEAGGAVFLENGCGSCHTLADQGENALGNIGPNLDAELVNEDADYIRTQIIAPDTEIAEGFSDGIMPDDYEQTIPAPDLDALVAYLDTVTAEGAGNPE